MNESVEYFLQRYEQNKESYYDNFFQDKFKDIKQLNVDKTTDFWLKYGKYTEQLEPFLEGFSMPPYTRTKVSLFNFVYKDRHDNIFEKCVRSAINFKILLKEHNFCENIFIKEYVKILYGTTFLSLGNISNFSLRFGWFSDLFY